MAAHRKWAHYIPTAPRRARALAAALLGALLLAPIPARAQGAKAFATPEEAVAALTNAAKASELDAVLALFGPEGRELIVLLRSGDRSPEP